MKTVICIFLLGCTTGLLAQSGNYFLSHYSPADKHFDNVCFDMAQDQRGVMYFATKAGVLEFDGSHWDLLHGQSAVYSLQINPSGNIFWGGANGFGKIDYDDKGFQKIEMLSDTTVTNVFQTLAVGDVMYFLSDDAIYIYSSSNPLQKIQSTDETGSFTKIFELFGKIYVNTEGADVYAIASDKLEPSTIALTENVIFYSRIDNSYVIGTADNRIYTCSEDLKLRPVTIEDQAYANASVIINGKWVNRQLLALGTLRGGVIFLNPITGKTTEIVNYTTGLPDNEVFALMSDRHQNIWVAHDYGYTKVSPFMPFRSFSHYAGLQGNLLCAYSFGNTVYAGTSLGLFKLQKEDVYDELVYYVDVEIPRKRGSRKKQEVSEPKTKPEQKVEETESKKGGFFSFLRKKKKDQPQQVQTSPVIIHEPDITETVETKGSDFRKEKRTQKILRSSQYVFRKVQGIDAKITHLVAFKDKLLATGLGGIYEVSALQAKSILSIPVRYSCVSQKRNTVFASTYEDEVLTLEFINKKWEQTNTLDQLEDQINYIFEGNENEIWLCGLDKIYKVETVEDEVRIAQTLKLINPNFETTVGIATGANGILLANANGFYQYNQGLKGIVQIDSLPKPTQYFAQDGNILYHDQHGWKMAGSQPGQRSLQLLNLFQDLRFITADNTTNNLWMISGSNELYKFYGEHTASNEVAFPIFLKSIINHDKKIGIKGIKINEEQSAVKFEVVQPDYISPQAIEFRYLLKGMSEEWSEWSSSNNVMDFPYLPPGDYELQVQAKNIFGQIASLDAMPFEVQPPYWKRSWFYALEFAVFASLVLLSFRLSTRYRIISRILSLLTIILLIQFIQTVINATIMTKDSPVIDFFIQVCVALLILPVEGYLRNLMLRSLDTSSKIYKFVRPKGIAGIIEKEKTED